MWRYSELTPRQKEVVDRLREGWFITNDIEYWHLRPFPHIGVVKRVSRRTLNSLSLYGVISKDTTAMWTYHLNTVEEEK